MHRKMTFWRANYPKAAASCQTHPTTPGTGDGGEQPEPKRASDERRHSEQGLRRSFSTSWSPPAVPTAATPLSHSLHRLHLFSEPQLPVKLTSLSHTDSSVTLQLKHCIPNRAASATTPRAAILSPLQLDRSVFNSLFASILPFLLGSTTRTPRLACV